MKAKTGYIRLGDAATFINGFAFKPDHWGDSGLPIIRIQNLNNEMAEFNYYNGPIPNKYVVHDGDILISWSASLGAYEWKRGEALLNQHIFKVVFDKAPIKKHFLRYAVLGNLAKMEKDAHGATMRHIVKKDFDNTLIPYPSIEEQQRIVDELDLLTGIIDKKNAQLRDLDALAQSIFYEMFGDPITNDKGWECCALKDVATIVGGSTPKTNIEEYWGGSNYWVTPAELHGERYYGATERTISDLAVKSTNLTLLPIGTVLLSSRAPIGKVAITTVPMYCNQGFKNVICSDRINNEYICQALRGKTEYLQALGTGATFKEISKKTTENIKIAIPPLALQKKFAAKVQMIEQQKKVVAQSLVDAQALFDSKMSHYFV